MEQRNRAKHIRSKSTSSDLRFEAPVFARQVAARGSEGTQEVLKPGPDVGSLGRKVAQLPVRDSARLRLRLRLRLRAGLQSDLQLSVALYDVVTVLEDSLSADAPAAHGI